MRTVALVTAAGRGSRFGSMVPKQYMTLGGRPLLRWSLDTLLRHAGIDGVMVVIDPADRECYEAATSAMDLLPCVNGGPTRQASVRAGLEALAAMAPRDVLIHDGARPGLSYGLLDRLMEQLERHEGVVPTIPVADTLRRFTDGRAIEDVPRAQLYRVQTPQGFRFATILAAHRAASDDGATDDAALLMRLGRAVVQVPGEIENLKVTEREDLAAAERVLLGPALRWATGHGFDVHRFVEDRPLWLLGLELPGEPGLLGHSDADVGLHAVTDALLGGIGAGDIGQHFPPSDERWRDAPSAMFAQHAVALVRDAGATVEHVDVTIIGERPRIGPHRERLRTSLAAILGIDIARTSVKATTTERLGFTGRGEGLAAQAVATLAFWR